MEELKINSKEFSTAIRDALDLREPTHNFVKQKEPDRHAAALRLAAAETMLDNWHYEINKTNTREMPLSLLRKYEEVYSMILEIRDMEQSIVVCGRTHNGRKY